MHWPLRYQILLPMAVLTAVAMAAVSAIEASLSARAARTRIEQQLRSVAGTLAASQFPLTTAVLLQTRGLSGVEFLVTDEDGAVLASTRPGAAPPPQWQISDPAAIELNHVALLLGEPYYHAAVRVERHRIGQPPQVLHLYYPEEIWRAAWRGSVLPPLAIGVVAVVVMVLLAAAIAARVSRPLQQLQQQVERIAQGDFQPAAWQPRGREVGELAASINHMAQMLARYEDQVRRSERLRTLDQLAGGVAHRIRNALTGCRMAVDLHRRNCPAAGDAESLDVAVQQLELAERYVRRFLTLGRGSEGRPEAVDLAALAEGVLALVRPAASHTGVALRFEPPATPLVVRGDRELLEQLLVNLLVNAVEAAGWRDPAAADAQAAHARAEEAAVELRLVPLENPPRAQIVVADTGQGPPPEVAERLFEPLVTGKPDGTGLGLAVARQAAEQHGGTISWQRTEGMTRFLVELPLAPVEEELGETARGR